MIPKSERVSQCTNALEITRRGFVKAAWHSCGTTKPGGFLAVEWPYDKIKMRLEQVYAMATSE